VYVKGGSEALPATDCADDTDVEIFDFHEINSENFTSGITRRI
jgi:hypothetical protein